MNRPRTGRAASRSRAGAALLAALALMPLTNAVTTYVNARIGRALLQLVVERTCAR